MNTPTVVFLKAHRSINLNAVIAVQALDDEQNVVTTTSRLDVHIAMLQVQMNFGWHVLLTDQDDMDRFDNAWSQFNWSRKVGN